MTDDEERSFIRGLVASHPINDGLSCALFLSQILYFIGGEDE